MGQPSLQVWLLAARPKTLWAGMCPVLIGTAMAYAAGALHLASAIAALLGAVLIQIGTNFANDYYDFLKGADTEERVGPTRATQAGLVTPVQMRNATALVLALAFVVGLYLVYRGGWPILLIGVLSIAFAVLYTGGPYPLAYLGLGDVFVLVFFGPVAVGGTYYVQALELPGEVLIAGLAPGLFSVAILTVNNLRDIESDRRSGKRTLPARFGMRFGRAEYAVALAGASLVIPAVLVLLRPEHRWCLIAAFSFLAALPAIRQVLRLEGAALNPYLGRTGQLLLLYSLLFAVGWNL
jgi:1,4-dihydroxy-2-naphthoate polyprenyltransferase